MSFNIDSIVAKIISCSPNRCDDNFAPAKPASNAAIPGVSNCEGRAKNIASGISRCQQHRVMRNRVDDQQSRIVACTLKARPSGWRILYTSYNYRRDDRCGSALQRGRKIFFRSGPICPTERIKFFIPYSRSNNPGVACTNRSSTPFGTTITFSAECQKHQRTTSLSVVFGVTASAQLHISAINP